MGYEDICDVSKMQGETLASISGCGKGSERVEFGCESGKKFLMWYDHDCCASCEIEDVCGDIADLIGAPLELAEEVRSYEGPKTDDESYTWTFYKFATIKGAVTLRWYGSSNGYYSESVTFEEVKGGES